MVSICVKCTLRITSRFLLFLTSNVRCLEHFIGEFFTDGSVKVTGHSLSHSLFHHSLHFVGHVPSPEVFPWVSAHSWGGCPSHCEETPQPLKARLLTWLCFPSVWDLERNTLRNKNLQPLSPSLHLPTVSFVELRWQLLAFFYSGVQGGKLTTSSYPVQIWHKTQPQ